MRSSDEFSVEAWFRLARNSTQAHRGMGNGGLYIGGQDGPTASWDCTGASLTSFLRRLQGVQLTGKGVMSQGTDRVWDGS